jgi:DNA polymerase-3 subunit alpha
MALQEMNLYKLYGEVYWNAACLSVNASADDSNESSGSTNYGKIASAIAKMQTFGIKVVLPDINEATFGFVPNEKENNIMFGLKGINGLGDDVVKIILGNRPYTSFKDFMERVGDEVGNVAIINLIKAGCFDKLEAQDRPTIMKDFIKEVVLKTHPPLKKLTMAHFEKVFEYELYDKKIHPMAERYYNFYKYVKQPVFCKGGDSKNLKIYLLDERAVTFFNEFIKDSMKYGVDYFDKQGQTFLICSSIQKFTHKILDHFKKEVTSNLRTLKQYNSMLFNKFSNEMWEKYCDGSIYKWEMDALSFYYTRHELAEIDCAKMGVVDFFQLPPTPQISFVNKTKRGEYTQYSLYKIIGTVLDRNKIKHTITLLTPTGVVEVKMYSDLFVSYNKQISRKNPDGSKTVIDKSWFSRGTKLQILGFRRDDTFIPRKYNNTIYRTVIAKIDRIGKYEDYSVITERPLGIEDGEAEID